MPFTPCAALVQYGLSSGLSAFGASLLVLVLAVGLCTLSREKKTIIVALLLGEVVNSQPCSLGDRLSVERRAFSVRPGVASAGLLTFAHSKDRHPPGDSFCQTLHLNTRMVFLTKYVSSKYCPNATLE